MLRMFIHTSLYHDSFALHSHFIIFGAVTRSAAFGTVFSFVSITHAYSVFIGLPFAYAEGAG